MNRELFLAILAMDSYNRGYGQGVRLRSGETGDVNELDRVLGNGITVTVYLYRG